LATESQAIKVIRPGTGLSQRGGKKQSSTTERRLTSNTDPKDTLWRRITVHGLRVSNGRRTGLVKSSHHFLIWGVNDVRCQTWTGKDLNQAKRGYSVRRPKGEKEKVEVGENQKNRSAKRGAGPAGKKQLRANNHNQNIKAKRKPKCSGSGGGWWGLLRTGKRKENTPYRRKGKSKSHRRN